MKKIIPVTGRRTEVVVQLDNETVWLTADQMSELFQRNKSIISRHIKNIYGSGELDRNSFVAEMQTYLPINMI